MGVHGLWRLLDASGKPVPLETLEGKVLAIDVSIWIHQVLQGYQDRKGSAVPNAHLLGLFHRICKLLYFKIKPVFVFDGGVPMLKKNTIASRKKQKSIAATKAHQMKQDLLQNLIKHTAVKGALALGNGEKQNVSSQESSSSKTANSIDDMFKLPSMPSQNESLSDDIGEDYEDYDSETSVELSPRKNSRWKGNIHSVDVTSNDFKALPADVRYDVLTDLKETRKQNSWGRLHEMPAKSHEFSNFQMNRLLKRRRVQESLEVAEKEMGGKTLTLEELERLLTEQGIETKRNDNVFRIASDSATRLIFINDPKSLKRNSIDEETDENFSQSAGSSDNPASRDSVEDRSIDATNSGVPMIADLNEYDLDSDWDSDPDVVNLKDIEPSPLLRKKYFGKQRINPALAYMLEHAGIPENEIVALMDGKREKIADNDKVLSEEKSKVKLNFDEKVRDESKLDEKSKIKLKLDEKVSDESKLDEKSEIKLKLDKKVSDESQLEEKSEIKLKFNEKVVDGSKLEEKRNDTELVEKNETSDEEIVFLSRKKESEKNFEKAGSSKSHLDFDALMGVSKICDTKTDDKSSPKISIEDTSSTIEITNTIDTECQSTNSDTDSDFVEIQDVPIPDDKKSVLEILVKSNEILADEEDIFADVFAKDKTDISDTSSRDISILNDSTPSTSFRDIEEPTVEITNIFHDRKEPDPKNFVEPRTTESTIDVPMAEPTDFVPEPSTSRAQELSNQVDKFKPELLKANTEKLITMEAQLENEHTDLAEHIGKLERQATAVTDQMRMEAQDLLRLFGIPYVVAPMEAEAQCAYLETIKLTDGTVTDDSDIWLFGGRCVYKNFFNNNKRVMEYKSIDIQHHFKLSREQMIQLALLVGSDYTVGVPGIGPVTALEIIAAFPTEGEDLLRGLGNFCTWIKNGRSAGPGRTALRNKLRNVEIEKGFPSQAVVQAYLYPTVDESKESFTWSKPNLTLLADYTRQKFGWTKLKFEETISPVVKKLAEAKSQKGITAYFSVHKVPKSIETTMSKRVQKAVQRLGNAGEEIVDDVEEESSGKAKRSRKKRDASSKESEEMVDSGVTEMSTTEIDDTSMNVEKTGVASRATKKLPLRNGKNVDEFIPQREKDRVNAAKKKLRAIEVFRKSKKAPARGRRAKRAVGKVTKEANLSESSDSA